MLLFFQKVMVGRVYALQQKMWVKILIGICVIGIIITITFAILGVKGKGPMGKLLGGKNYGAPSLKKGGAFNVLGSRNAISNASGGIKIDYKPGRVGNEAGGGFHAAPKGLPSKVATLSYDVFIPSNFQSKGGKLPGLEIGTHQKDGASGGSWSQTAGSARCMWRDDQLIGYIYMPLGSWSSAFNAQGPSFKAVADSLSHSGINLFYQKQGGLKLKKGHWNSIAMRVDLGDAGRANGSFQLTCNGVNRKVAGVLWRRTDKSKICAVTFQSFAGGSTNDWAFKIPMYTLYKNIRFSTS